MIDFGTVRPGTTLYIPFATYDSNDPSASVTLTGLATTDIEVYKDGSVTQRASDSGYALLDTDGIDFDGVTGIHGISIDLADNTTAGFWAAGSQYTVVIASVTVDAATINFIAATFRIGYANAILNTTIATLASQTSFTLTAGPAEDDALNGMWCVIHDVASAVQLGKALILDYTGSTKTVTLAAGTTFTAAATDNIAIMDLAPIQPTITGRTLDVSTGGEAGIDWANVGTPGSTVSLSATTVATVTTTTTATTATNVTTVNGLATGVITAAAIATGAIDADALAADAGTEIGTAVWATAARTLTAATNITSNGTALALTTAGYVRADLSSFNNEIELMTDQAAANFVSFFDNASGAATIILSNVATATALDAVDNLLDTEIAALTTELAKVPKSDSNVTWNATALASIQTEANDALVANNLDHLVLSAVDTNFATTVHLDSVIGHLADAGTTATFDRTTDALEILGAATAPSAATIADAVWDEALSGHLAAGSTGEALNAAGAAGDPWTTTLPGAYTGSQAGKMLSDILTDTAEIGAAGAGLTNINLPNQTMDIVGNITGNLSGSVGSVTGAVGSVTGNVGGNVVGSVASVTGAVGSVTGTVGGIAGTITTLDALDTAQDTQHSTTQTAIADVPTNAELATALGTADDAVLAAIAALNNVSNASVATAVLTTAMTEAYRSTGGTGTVAQLLYEIIAHLGEKSISGTTLTLKKLDGSTTAKTYTLDSAVTPTSITEAT